MEPSLVVGEVEMVLRGEVAGMALPVGVVMAGVVMGAEEGKGVVAGPDDRMVFQSYTESTAQSTS